MHNYIYVYIHLDGHGLDGGLNCSDPVSIQKPTPPQSYEKGWDKEKKKQMTNRERLWWWWLVYVVDDTDHARARAVITICRIYQDISLYNTAHANILYNDSHIYIII